MRRRWAVACSWWLVAGSLGQGAAAQGRIDNARTETRSAAAGLDRAVSAVPSQRDAAWVGYRAPMIAGQRLLCCSDTGTEACRLEGGGGVTMTSGMAAGSTRVEVEPSTEFMVLARVERGDVTRVRLFTPDCGIDAGGMRVVWLTDVAPEDSVRWLAAVIAKDSDKGHSPALAALALQSTPAALKTLLALARDAASARVRGQALFWLAQRAGQEAVAAITGAIERDPETDVKKRAVFALSQLPKDEGIPKLIEVARSNRNREVRKQAMFWLGETKDPRAVRFFEEVLSR